MRSFFVQIDTILRGGLSQRQDLQAGRVPARIGSLFFTTLLLGGVYGVFMGLFAAFRAQNPTSLQLIAAAVKVPLLFILTLIVTLPSLYVFSALAGSRLRFADTLKLLFVGMVVNLALLASFGPVTAFFTLSTESYHFMVVLNVIFFAIAGLGGLAFLRRALEIVFESPARAEGETAPQQFPPPVRPAVPEGGAPGSPAAAPVVPAWVLPARSRPEPGSLARRIFYVWIVIYGVVGAQMGWILRPFIGSPDLAFSLFRERESNFFFAILNAIRSLFG